MNCVVVARVAERRPTTVEEAWDTYPLSNVPNPVKVEAPVTESVEENAPVPPVKEPMVALLEKKFVEEAVVEKRAVVVAFVAERLPVRVSRAPSNVRFAESVKAPAVVMYGTRPLVSAETVRLVVEAVPK